MKLLLTLIVGAVFCTSQAFAACSNTVSVKDGGGASRTFCRGTDGGSNYVSYFNLVDSTGANVASVSAGGALKVDNSAVTQPISAASLPLPTSAATSTKQSDGSQKTQIVDGSGNVIAATSNALNVNISSGGTVAQGSSTSGQGGSLVMGAVTTSAPSYTNAQTSPLSLTVAGDLRTTFTAQSATGSAPPANAVYMGANGSGATGGQMRGLITCDLHAKYDASDTGSITMVTGVSGRKVYICGFILATGGTATNLKLREGSDANCATNGADLTPAYQLVANDRIGMMSPFWTGLVVSTNAYYVCVNASAANAHQAEVWYTIL